MSRGLFWKIRKLRVKPGFGALRGRSPGDCTLLHWADEAGAHGVHMHICCFF